MTAFSYELAAVAQRQEQARPNDPEGVYALPWYLVLGEPGSGRTGAIQALNATSGGAEAIQVGAPQVLCNYWLTGKAIYIEPGHQVLGQARLAHQLTELCQDLRAKRPREPIDGIIVVINADRLCTGSEREVDEYAKALRRYLIEVAQALEADVPAYVVVTAYDTLWGFGDAFQWTAERRDEEPWGFVFPPNVPAEETNARLPEQLEGLNARIESQCFSKLAAELAPDVRSRAFQHLAEYRTLMDRLKDFMHVLTMGNAFERAPWIRAMVMGSGTPGTGHILRHRVEAMAQFGLAPPQHSGTRTPGGMPIHGFVDAVLMPERDIVKTAVRWRDDRIFQVGMVLGTLLTLSAIVTAVVRALL